MNRTFKELLKEPKMKSEWRFTANTWYISHFPKFMWGKVFDNMLEKYPPLRKEKYLDALNYLSDNLCQKGTGENEFSSCEPTKHNIITRQNVYEPNEIAKDKTLADVVAYNFIIGKNSPLAIVVAGGGYRCISMMNEGFPIARLLNQNGYSAIVLTYRVGAKGRAPRPMSDVARAIAKARAEADVLHIDRDRISLWGFSASGHLCGYLGAKWQDFGKNCRPNALVLSYPVVLLEGEFAHKGSVNNLLGKSASQLIKNEYSFHNFISEDYPPTFVWHCQDDKSVSIVNSEVLTAALVQNKVKHEYLVYPTGGHGLGGAFGMYQSEWFDRAIAFLKGANC